VTENSEKIERLRRVAYGPGAGAAERAEAEAALRALAEPPADRADAVAAAPPPGVAVTSPGEGDGDVAGGSDAGDADDDAPGSIWGRRIRLGWLVPIVVGSLVAGVLIALGATGHLAPQAQFNGPDRTSESDGPRPVSQPGDGTDLVVLGGDLEAADAWFEGSATASDAYPFPGLLESNAIDPYDVRFALAGGEGWNVWVARSAAGKLCLLLADARDGTGSAGCFARASFAAQGASLGLGDRMAHWFGHEVTASPTNTTVGDDPQEEQRSLPQAAPGDVGAALGWFSRPQTELDVFPTPDLLAHLGIAGQDIRNVSHLLPPEQVIWIAKQGTVGFCLLITEAQTVASSCATVDEFRESGLNLEAGDLTASWDGKQVAAG
jgi:hypothetical protein